MQTIYIQGGHTLAGHIRPAGAKNSVLPLLAASLLCGEPAVLNGVPELSDVDTSLALLRAVGAQVARCGGAVTVHPVADTALTGQVPAALAGAMRSSVFYLAPLLCRTGCVRLPLPGGCRLGPRPVDIHLAGLAAMGAQVEVEASAVTLRRRQPLCGVDFTLRLPSVGATLTLMMAACAASGVTVLRGAACEPEIEDTANFLRAAGASITGSGTPVITVQGGRALGGAVFTPLPDRIAATTYAAAAASAGGRITIEGCRPALLGEFLPLLRAAGCEVQPSGEGVAVTRDPGRPLRGGHSICTGGWPAFATDAAPLAAAMLLTGDAPSEIYDAMFQNRFACAEGFAAMGAAVRAEGRRLRLEGRAPLHSAAVTAPDLRGGAALMVAALAAKGTTTLTDTGHIARGYPDLPGELARLGAACRR